MAYIRKKTTAVFILISMLTLAGGFCYGSVASASAMPMSDMGSADMPQMDGAHCHGQKVAAAASMPISNTVMPCCVDRHDGQPTTLPAVLKDKVKFSDISLAQPVDIVVSSIKQKTYVSSPSPPPEPDILSSVVKIE